MLTLSIKALRVFVQIGIHSWEQRIKQPLLIDIHASMVKNDIQDQLENTVDYDQICQQVTTLASASSFYLIETLAEKVATFLIETDQLQDVNVTVSKPFAVKNASGVAVTAQKTRALSSP